MLKTLRHTLLFALLALTAIACKESTKGTQQPASNQGTANTGDFKAMPGQSTPIHFSHLEMNFKPVPSGDTVIAIYPFKNMSQETVRISQAVTSCQCMQTKYPQGNIQPGQLGEIEVHFLTKDQKGRHEKIISIVLENYDDPITLRLNGEINAPM